MALRQEIPFLFLAADVVYSRALGNKNNAFLEAWKLNVENQNLMVINNNTLAQADIGYVFKRPEIDFEVEPTDTYERI
jgi:hypothetical protein